MNGDEESGVKPVQVIEYANPYAQPRNPDEPAAWVLGIFAAILGALAVPLYWRGRWDDRIVLGLLANLLGLIAGGVGWGLSRHSRPNRSYRLCAWANTINWLIFAGVIAYVLNNL